MNARRLDHAPPRDRLPDALQRALDGLVEPGEKVCLSVATDICLDGRYGTAFLVATDRRLLGLSPKGAGLEVVEVPLARVTGVQVEDLFGSIALRARTEERGVILAVYSRSLSEPLGAVPDHLEKLVRQAAAQPPADGLVQRNGRGIPSEQRRCRRCGQVIPHGMGVCPSCLDRRRLLARFLGYTTAYWPLAVCSLAILLAATFISLMPPLLMRLLIDQVLQPAARAAGAAASPGPAAQAIAELRVPIPFVGPVSPGEALGILVGLLLLINVSRNALGAVRSYLLAQLGQQITFDLRGQVYRHLHRLSLSFYNERDTGRIMTSVTQDVGRLQDFLSEGLQDIIRDGLTILIIVGILFYIDARLAAYILLPVPLIVIITLRFGELLHRTYHSLWRRWAAISTLLADVIPGVRVVKAFAQEQREVERFEVSSEALLTGELRAARLRSVFAPLMAFLTSLGTLIVWWAGGHKVLDATLTLGSFVAFTGYMWQFYGPVENLCRMNHRFQHAATSAERVFEVLDTEPDVADAVDARPMPPVHGEVEFRGVGFGYEGDRQVIHDLSFTVEPGEMVGLVGHSGAGKSTLVNLLCRFYDIHEGTILVDGVDIRQVQLKSLRDQIGVVLQDPFLFSGSVADNISYGKPDATLEEIVAAAKAANAHDFIVDLTEGYDTLLGERGARLSGGERQRVSIARAILRNPRILILDEATSSMDTETEAKIQEALGRLVRGRTTFAIAHRLSTLKNAHRLLVIEKGRLEEIGTHEELLARGGIYAHLCELQSELSRMRVV